MRLAYLFMFVTVLLTSCMSRESSLPISTSTLYVAVTPTPVPSTPLPSATYTSTITQTLTPTVGPTLSSDQFPKLSDFILQSEDVQDYDLAYLNFYFWRGENRETPPLLYDMTGNLKSQGLCVLDCIETEWMRSSENYLTITLIREESAEVAIKKSLDLCAKYLLEYTAHFETPVVPSGFEDCRMEMFSESYSPYTWFLGNHAADVYGRIYIVVDVVFPLGDDYTEYQRVLDKILSLQLDKLKKLKYPIDP